MEKDPHNPDFGVKLKDLIPIRGLLDYKKRTDEMYDFAERHYPLNSNSFSTMDGIVLREHCLFAYNLILGTTALVSGLAKILGTI
jgi:hypothetical protein